MEQKTITTTVNITNQTFDEENQITIINLVIKVDPGTNGFYQSETLKIYHNTLTDDGYMKTNIEIIENMKYPLNCLNLIFGRMPECQVKEENNKFVLWIKPSMYG